MAESILKLRVDSAEYEQKVRRASDGISRLAASLQGAGKTFANVDREQLKYIQDLGKMDTASTKARGRVSELSNAFVELQSVYNRLSPAEKQSEGGRALAKSLGELQQRTIAAKRELQDLNKAITPVDNSFKGAAVSGTDFGSMLGELGGKMGLNTDIIGMLTSGTIGYTAAMGAAIGVLYKAADAWADYNSEFAKQRQVTSVTTGVNDVSADAMTRSARALSRTFDVDFRETINAANTLMTQFGVSGQESIELIRQGLQGMILGDGQKLLQMIQQYGPAFQSAGVSASQLIAVIHNSEGGIFTDENMNAIVMGIKNIRLMTEGTSKALAQLGIDGNKMSRDISDGTITIFDALKQVASAIDDVGGNSKEVGQVMQQVFGRQGAMAGTNLGKAIATLNTNLEETKLQTGELNEKVLELARAHEELERSMQKAFGVKGWEEMKTEIETGVVMALKDVVDGIANVEAAFQGMSLSLKGDVNTIDVFFQHMKEGLLGILNPALAVIETLRGLGSMVGFTSGTGMGDMLATVAGGLTGEKPSKPVAPRVSLPTGGRGTSGGVRSGSAVHREKGEEAKIQERINKLVEEAYKADDKRRGAIREEVAGLQEQLAKLKAIKDNVLGVVHAEKAQKTVNYENTTGGFTTSNVGQLQQMLKSQLSTLDLGSLEYELVQKNLGDLSTLTNVVQQAIAAGLTIPQSDVDELWEAVFNGERMPAGVFDGMIQKFAEEWKKKTGKELVFSGGKLGEKSSSKADPLDIATKVSGSLNSIVGGLEQLGVDVPQGIQQVVGGLQVLTGIVSAISALVSLINAKETVSMVSSLVPGFAGGGVVPKAAGGWVVPGRSFSNDKVPVLANSGEVVLNRAEVGNLASQLSDGGGGLMEVTTRVDGEDLLICINKALGRRGKGHVVVDG